MPVAELDHHLVDIDGLVTADQLRATVDAVAEWQLPSGMVPWYPGGHADPWNHTEALMALMLGGHRGAAERGFDWLQSLQREDGAWHQYYLADGVEEDKLDANCVAYVAAGVWFHWLTYRDRGALEAMWPMVRDATDFVLALQQPRGEIIWARHADATPFTFALLTGSSSICHSLRCSIAIARELGHERPNWELGASRLYRGDPRRPRRLRPEAPLGDGLVLPGAVRDRHRRGRPRAPRAPARRVHHSTAGASAACRTDRGSPRPRPASARSPTSRSATTRRRSRAVLVGAAPAHRGRPLLDRHRAPRGGQLPRWRAVDLHRRSGDPRRRRAGREVGDVEPVHATTTPCRS